MTSGVVCFVPQLSVSFMDWIGIEFKRMHDGKYLTIIRNEAIKLLLVSIILNKYKFTDFFWEILITSQWIEWIDVASCDLNGNSKPFWSGEFSCKLFFMKKIDFEPKHWFMTQTMRLKSSKKFILMILKCIEMIFNHFQVTNLIVFVVDVDKLVHDIIHFKVQYIKHCAKNCATFH